MGSSGGSSSTKITPPWWARQHLPAAAQQAANNFNAGSRLPSGPLTAPLTADTLGGISGIRNFASGGGLSGDATEAFRSTIRGDFLDPSTNPGLQSVFNQSANLVDNRLNTQFASANRLGSGAEANARASALTDLAGSLTFDNFNRERQRQLTAASQAGSVNQTRLGELEALLQAGGIQQGADQAQIDDALFRADEPNRRLDRLLNQLNASTGGGSTTTTPLERNRTAGVLGGALSGAATGAKLGTIIPGLGNAVGAIGGGLLGAAAGFF